MGSCEEVELLSLYHELESWVTSHARSLDLLLSDLRLALQDESEQPYTLHYAPDVYEIVRFGFSILEEILDNSVKLQEKKFRDELLRNQVARDFLFHGLPNTTHIVLLPPYKKELSTYLSLVVEHSQLLRNQQDLLDNLYNVFSVFDRNNLYKAGDLSVNPDELLSHGLTSQIFEKWFGILVEHFKDLLFVAAGWSAQGITVINDLFKDDCLADSLACFAGLVDIEDIEIRKVSGPWLDELNRYRSRRSYKVANQCDARAIEGIFSCNERLMPNRQILLLVSSTGMMNALVNKNKSEATIHIPSGPVTVFLRDLYYFQAYKGVAPRRDHDDFFGKAYGEAWQQWERLEEFKRWAPKVKELESTAEVVEDTADVGSKVLKNPPDGSCQGAVYKELEDMLAKINSLKNRIENVRYLEGRPEYARKHIEQWAEVPRGKLPYVRDILDVIEKLEGQREWHDFLQGRLRVLEEKLEGSFLQFSATATPYVQEYTPEQLESFIGFPFRTTVANPELKARIAELERLTDERYWTRDREDKFFVQQAEAVQRALQDLISCAIVLEDEDPEKALVWAILFFAYGRMSAALAIVNKWIGQGKGSADESFRFLSSLIAYRRQDEEAYADALGSLEKSATVYPESALFPHLSAFLVEQAVIKKIPVPNYDLKSALSFCMSALEKVEKDTELHAMIVNNAAYCYTLLYTLDQDVAHLNAVERCVADLNEIVEKMKMEWKPGWLDTKGTMHLFLARRAKERHSEEDLQHHKGKAIEYFTQALGIGVLQEGINITSKHLREIKRL